MQRPIRLMTLSPGHFHAALLHKEMPRGIHPRAHVYAPLDSDLLAHLDRIAAFNSREESPTRWELDVRTSPDPATRMVREQPGNTVVLAGRNRPKIDAILASVTNGLHVIADKPWVVDAEDFPKLETVFREADLRELVVWDVMTERHELPTILQRELIRANDVFGTLLPGRPDAPALTLESLHGLKKSVAGTPLRRPAWWFDVLVAGEALADVGTHLFDLALWFVSPGQAVDYRQDLKLLDAKVWPTPLDATQLRTLTGDDSALSLLKGTQLLYRGNGTALFTVRGIHVQVTTLWDYESADGDTHEAVARGSKSMIAIPKGDSSKILVTPNPVTDPAVIRAALVRRVDDWQSDYPGVTVTARGDVFEVTIPDVIRTTHEEHFAEVLREFVRYFHQPRQVPAWEQPNLLAKYWLSTHAVELAKRQQRR